MSAGRTVTLFTVGHSNRSAEELVEVLLAHEIALVIDVRRYPASRRHPHFNRGELARVLRQAGIGYRHEEWLGGHRDPRPSSPDAALSEPFLRGYADHMRSPTFVGSLEQVLSDAAERRTAVMCAERDPASCHRRLLSDWVVGRGHEVRHLLAPDETAQHALDPRARVDPGGQLSYPAPEEQLELF